jgi:hypothetical protein
MTSNNQDNLSKHLQRDLSPTIGASKNLLMMSKRSSQRPNHREPGAALHDHISTFGDGNGKSSNFIGGSNLSRSPGLTHKLPANNIKPA